MADLKLLRIEEGDDQKSLIDKTNANFSNLLLFDGGPYGKIGPEGAQGDQGITGPVGSYGDLGQRGTIWVLNDSNPGATGFIIGDLWLNTSEGLGLPVYQFDGSSWNPYGFNIISQDLFRNINPVPTTDGDSSYSGYYFSSTNPEKYTFVISDNPITNSSVSANPQYSKMVISNLITKPILEFSKVGSLSNSSLYARNPRFVFTGQSYSLRFQTMDLIHLESSTGNINFTTTSARYIQRSTGFTMNLSSDNQGLSMNALGVINFDFTFSGKFIPSNRNIAYDTTALSYTMPVRFEFKADSSDTKNALLINSNVPTIGGFRHKTNVSPTRNSTLFRVYSSTETFVRLFASGELVYDKRINSYQSPQSPTVTGLGVAYTGSGSTILTDWFGVVPTVVSAPSTSTNRINASNGVDYQVALPSGSSNPKGIYLWTTATGGTGTNNNGGWLNLLNPMEGITLRVRVTNTNYFRFVGLGTGITFDTVPSDPNTSSLQAIDLTNSSLGVSDVEFTIVNISNNTAGATAGNKRWFKVYYSAWGGTLGYVKCGVMYTANSTGL